MNLDDIIKDLEDDLERMHALRTGGTKAYFETTNRQNRRKNIQAIIDKLETDWGSSKLEKQDRDFDLKRKYD
jgi:hypothetical protein